MATVWVEYGYTESSTCHHLGYNGVTEVTGGSLLFPCLFQQGSARFSKHSAMNQQGDSKKSATIQQGFRENQQGEFRPRGSLNRRGWTVNWWTWMFLILSFVRQPIQYGMTSQTVAVLLLFPCLFQQAFTCRETHEPKQSESKMRVKEGGLKECFRHECKIIFIIVSFFNKNVYLCMQKH